MLPGTRCGGNGPSVYGIRRLPKRMETKVVALVGADSNLGKHSRFRFNETTESRSPDSLSMMQVTEI